MDEGEGEGERGERRALGEDGLGVEEFRGEAVGGRGRMENIRKFGREQRRKNREIE